MPKVLKLLFISVFFVFPFLTASGSDLRSDAEKIIKSFYGNNANLVFLKVDIEQGLKRRIENEVKQKFFKDFLHIWKIYENGEWSSTAVMDNVYGKTMPITFLVIFDRDGRIEKVEVLKYREAYGGQVGNENWLNNFAGKDKSSSYVIGKEINTISGATISVNSMTLGIKKLTLLFAELKEKL